MVETLIIKCLIAKPTKGPFTPGISWITALVIAQVIANFLWSE